LLLGCLLQVEDFLDVDEHTHEPVEAAEPVHDPAHLAAVLDGNTEDSASDDTLVHGNNEDGEDGKDERRVVHANVEPHPAAVVGNEVNSCHIQHLVLLGHDMFLLLEGSDDTLTSH